MSDLVQRLRAEIEQLRVEQAQYEEEIERLKANLEHYEEALCDLHYKDELLFNIAYNNDMDGDTMRQVVRDFLKENEDVQ